MGKNPKKKNQTQAPSHWWRRAVQLPRIIWVAVVFPILLGVVGTVAYEWLNERATADAMRQLARPNVRGNVFGVMLRLQEIWGLGESIGKEEAAGLFRALPDRIQASHLDEQFCRSFDFRATEVDDEFRQAATAYCGVVSGFPKTETSMWDGWRRDSGVNEVSRSLAEIEAQLAMYCTLEIAEQYYTLVFNMMLHAGNTMGLSDTALLEGAEQIGLRPLQRPKSRIREYVSERFKITCP